MMEQQSKATIALIMQQSVTTLARLYDENASPQQQRLWKAEHDCLWGIHNLYRRRRHNYVERRRALILRAVNIASEFVKINEIQAAINQLDALIQLVPDAVLLRAARVCVLLIARRDEAKKHLVTLAGQRFCSVRWENIIFYQLNRLRKVAGVSNIICELERLLDCLQPSAGELQRIRMRLPELADHKFAIPEPADEERPVILVEAAS